MFLLFIELLELNWKKNYLVYDFLYQISLSLKANSMLNLYELIKDGLYYNKFVVDENIFVEYSCPLEDEQFGIFSQSDFLVHVLSGKKTWESMEGSWTAEAGQTLYLKKGANMIKQFFEDDFCMLAFFISDDLIKEAVNDVIGKVALSNITCKDNFKATALNSNVFLEGFFQSMLLYFSEKETPTDYLLKLKLKELLANIICSNENPELVNYFKVVADKGKPSLMQIMEQNFCFNLKLEEFAKLTNRSLSTFKRDFQQYYNTTPGKWLTTKRLECASKLIQNNFSNITQIAYKCGFEDVSHFSKAFKSHFGVAPSEYARVNC